MISAAGTSHIGSCLSLAEVMAVLYGAVLKADPRRPDWPDRDRLIMSKGHAAAIAYAALAEAGFIDVRELDQFGRNGSQLYGHVTHTGVPGVELSTGSLGHGLPVGCGMALTAKRDGATWRTFVVMSDGELDEGSNWEAILFAAHHELDNLVAVVDYNGIQSLDRVEATLRLEPLADKVRAFGWEPLEVPGHDISALRQALERVPATSGKPTLVIARTVKGKGVSWMEDKVLWHYRAPNEGELQEALRQIGDGG
jgi:transketolase